MSNDTSTPESASAKADKKKAKAAYEHGSLTNPDNLKPRMAKKLGVPVFDRITGDPGILTHLHIEADGTRFYRFQPAELNKKNGKPVEGVFMVPGRIGGGEDVMEPSDIPFDALGTKARDINSGFKGRIIEIIMHLDGCLHVNLQPTKRLSSGEKVAATDFSILRVVGPFIPILSEEQAEESRKKKPSPAGGNVGAFQQ